MKKMKFIGLIGLASALFVVAVPAAMAESITGANSYTDRTGRNDLGVQVGGAFSNADQLSDAVYFGANFSHGVSPWLAWGLEAGWQEADFDITNDNDLSMITVFGEVIGRMSVPDWPLVPYGVIGAGVLHAYTDTNTNNDDETAFAMKFGGGLDWFLSTNWVLNGEIAYIATGAEVTGGSANTEGLDHWRASAGLKYAF